MILVIGEIFLTPGGAQAGAQGAGLGAQRSKLQLFISILFGTHISKAGRGLQ